MKTFQVYVEELEQLGQNHVYNIVRDILIPIGAKNNGRLFSFYGKDGEDERLEVKIDLCSHDNGLIPCVFISSWASNTKSKLEDIKVFDSFIPIIEQLVSVLKDKYVGFHIFAETPAIISFMNKMGYVKNKQIWISKEAIQTEKSPWYKRIIGK